MKSTATDRRYEAALLYEEALARRAQGNPSGAFPRYRLVLEIARELDDRVWQAQIAAELGEMYRSMCELMDARRWHEEALALYRELGDAPRAAASLLHLGEVEHLAGEMVKAEALFRQALQQQVALADRTREGVARARLGRLLWDLKREAEGMAEMIRGWMLLRESEVEEAAALATRIRALRDRVGRIRYKRAVEGAVESASLRALLLG